MHSQFNSIAGTGAICLLEHRFREFVGTNFAVAVCNGTAAIHAALVAIGVGPCDEVITQSYSWGGSVTGILQCGAIPVFADIDDGFGLDPVDVAKKISSRTKAVILVHLFGFPSRTKELKKICDERNIALIEDCAQAFGAAQDGRSVGGIGIGCFSFSAGKTLGVGDGGMLTTNDSAIFERVIYHTQHPLRQLRDINGCRITNQFALNYRMSEPTAARALDNFDGAIRQVETRAREFEKLSGMLTRSFSSIKPIHVRASDRPSWHRYSPEVDRERFEGEYVCIEAFLEKKGFVIERGYIPTPLHREPALRGYLPVGKWREIRNLDLPSTENACGCRLGVAFNGPISNSHS